MGFLPPAARAIDAAFIIVALMLATGVGLGAATLLLKRWRVATPHQEG